MPNEAEHIQLALHNIKVIDHLRTKPEFCDWTATVTFYTALHIVEAVFFYARRHNNKRHGSNHETRESILKGTRSYQKIYQHYRPLQSASVIARYLYRLDGKGETFQDYMSAVKVRDKLIKYHLAALIKSASKFLSSNSGNLLNGLFSTTFK